jgi:hypothetical protein
MLDSLILRPHFCDLNSSHFASLFSLHQSLIISSLLHYLDKFRICKESRTIRAACFESEGNLREIPLAYFIIGSTLINPITRFLPVIHPLSRRETTSIHSNAGVATGSEFLEDRHTSTNKT